MRYRIVLALLLFWGLAGCEKEEGVDFGDKQDVDTAVKVTGTKWAQAVEDWDEDQVFDMLVYKDRLFMSYLYYNNGSFAYSGTYANNKLKHFFQNMGNSSGFDRLRIINDELYLVGNAGFTAVWKYEDGHSQHERAWDSYKNDNTPYYDYIEFNDVQYGGTGIAPYLRVSSNGEAGEAFDKAVRVFAVYKNELYCGGAFTKSGSTEIRGLAKWDGSKWVKVGGGLDGEVAQLLVYKDKLIALGSFKNAGSEEVNYIAQWDGTSWSSLGTGLSDGYGRKGALIEFGGELIVGGFFEEAGGVYSPYVAKWDGDEWLALPAGLPSGVGALAVYKNQLYASNAFLSDGNYLLRLE